MIITNLSLVSSTAKIIKNTAVVANFRQTIASPNYSNTFQGLTSIFSIHYIARSLTKQWFLLLRYRVFFADTKIIKIDGFFLAELIFNFQLNLLCFNLQPI